MKIALAIEHFDAGHGGAEQYAWGLARWLAGQGHRLDVFTARAAQTPDFIDRVHRLDVAGAPAAQRPLALAARLAEALRGTSYDIVHAFNHLWPGDVLRLGGGVHRAFETWNARSAAGPWGRLTKQLSYRWLPRYRVLRENECRQFDDPQRLFIAVSQRVADDMARFYPACRDRVRLIHNGVDTEYFRPASTEERQRARQALSLADEDVALLFVSNNFRLKGLHDLVNALPRVRATLGPSVRLIVAGRGRIAAFRRQAARTGVTESLIVCEPTDDMRARYAAADVLVHPSYYDAFGFVGLEAMACGLPIVMSRNSGVSEIMSDGEGSVLVDMPCPAATLADAIVRAAQPAFRARARSVQRQRAEQHTLDANYRRVIEVYGEVRDRKA